MSTKITLSLITLSVFCLTYSSRSEVIELVSNLSEGNTETGYVNSDSYEGVQFTTGTDTYELADVTLGIDGGTETIGGFFVQIWSSGSPTIEMTEGQPITLLETLVGNNDPASEGQYTYASGGLQLSSNTDYWIIAGTTLNNPNGYWWDFSKNYAYTGVTGASLGPNISSRDQGSTWGSWGIYNWEPHSASVNVTVIPEPSTISLFGIATATFVIFRKRKKYLIV